MIYKTDKKEKTIGLEELIYIIRRNFVICLVIILAFGTSGYFLSKLKEPVYSANISLTYTAYASDPKDTKNSINAMASYVNTVVDFCNTGIVLDRANYYYGLFVSTKSGESKNLSAFIDGLKENPVEVPEIFYNGNTRRFFDENSVSASINKNDNDDYSFVIELALKSTDRAVVQNGIRLVALAYANEARYAFGGVTTEIHEQVATGVAIPVRTETYMKIYVVVFLVLGVILAFAFAALRFMNDNTIKSSEDLERITGVSVLSFIEYQVGGAV